MALWGRLLVTGRVVGRVVDGRVVVQDGPGQQDKQISDRSPRIGPPLAGIGPQGSVQNLPKDRCSPERD